MGKALHENHVSDGQDRSHVHDWRKSMSDNVALALLVYTGLQIFVTVHAMKSGMSSIMPYILLVLLVVAIIPFCRKFEQRWTGLSDADAHDPSLAASFRRDQVGLWILAIGAPLLLTAFFRLIFG